MELLDLEFQAKQELATEEEKLIKEKLKEKLRDIFQTTLKLKMLNSEYEDLKTNYMKNGFAYFDLTKESL